MHFGGRRVFVHKRKAKICKSISQEQRQRFAKVFLKKRQRFAKVFKYSSIQKKYSNCFGSFQGDKKDMQVHNISLFGAKLQWHKWRFEYCGLHCPSTTELRAREGEELRPAKQGWVVCVSAALRPSFCWSLTAPESRGRPHILGNKYEHLVRWKSNSKCKLVTIEYPGPTSSNLDQWISRSKNYNCPSHIATYTPVHHKNKAFGRNLQTKQTLW